MRPILLKRGNPSGGFSNPQKKKQTKQKTTTKKKTKNETETETPVQY